MSYDMRAHTHKDTRMYTYINMYINKYVHVRVCVCVSVRAKLALLSLYGRFTASLLPL
jgi:hypothetical protein